MDPKHLPQALRRMVLAAILCGAGAVHARESVVDVLEIPGAGPVLLALPHSPDPVPVVVVVPDPAGADQRARAYTERLNAQGIATIEIRPGADAAFSAEVLAQRFGRLLRALIADRRFDARRVAVLGFGRGARIALSGAAGLPVAALYPGCAPLRAPGTGRALVLEAGSAPGSQGDCAAFRAALGGRLTHHRYATATYAWDFADAARLAASPWQPAPDAEGRVLVRPDLRVTEDAIGRVVHFMTEVLDTQPAEPGRE
ncbi:dienelactone hydrolase family protein [Plastoroseomonas hellenica]|uniref:hypothetical protein n=1 Tax=Plastoroseomonas hellenica TaxID=2687306 RepID=UPI001BA9560A|nr:hypothetical protein [Plastoroseomonas hellenica]MBR0645645.1 hypothetical protein [Plastoroseomonas hellenica]